MITISATKLIICLVLIIILTAKVVYRKAFYDGKVEGWCDGSDSCENHLLELFPEIKDRYERHKYDKLIEFLNEEE